MYRIELVRGNWYNISYGEHSFAKVRSFSHLRDVQFIGEGNNVVVIPRNDIVIGKAPACDVIIDDPYVQRRQCKIEIQEGHILIRDLGAREPTLVLRRGREYPVSNEGIEIYAEDILNLRGTGLRLLEARFE